jgi:hypothetical protein
MSEPASGMPHMLLLAQGQTACQLNNCHSTHKTFCAAMLKSKNPPGAQFLCCVAQEAADVRASQRHAPHAAGQ